MQATTYRREIFARPGDNLFLATHKAGHVFAEAPRERRNARGPVTQWNGSQYAVVQAAERHISNKRSATKVTLAKSRPFWYDCKCGRQTTDARAVKGMCSHGATFAGVDNGKGGNGGL